MFLLVQYLHLLLRGNVKSSFIFHLHDVFYYFSQLVFSCSMLKYFQVRNDLSPIENPVAFWKRKNNSYHHMDMDNFNYFLGSLDTFY